MKIVFKADKVKVRTGKPDNSAEVSFEIGEYQLKDIADLVSIVDQEIQITVETED